MVVNLEGDNKYMLTGQQHLREEHLLEINPSPHSLMEETWNLWRIIDSLHLEDGLDCIGNLRSNPVPGDQGASHL